MKVEDAKKLRDPFPAKLVSKLPKAGMMLDYVGHAATTDRLLQVDPDWTWEPMGLDDQGRPAFDDKGGLWIRLTVCGVTRPGYGEPGRIGPKEAVGDAIRNAAMRFGVALDLWSKEDLQAGAEERPTAPATPAKSATTRTPLPSGSSPTPADRGAHASPKQEKLIRDLVAKIRKRDAEHTAVKWYDSQPPISEWPIVTVSAAIGRLQGALKALEVPELPPSEAAFVAKAEETFDADSVPF